MVKSIVDKEDVRDFVSQRAGALLHRPIRARFTTRGTKRGADDPLQRLVDFGKAHPDVVRVTE